MHGLKELKRENIFKPFFLLLSVVFLFESFFIYVRSTFFLVMIVIKKKTEKEQERNFESANSMCVSHSQCCFIYTSNFEV